MWNIIFKGEIQAHYDVDSVKKDIAQMFNLDASDLDRLFSGAKIILKRNIPQAQVHHYLDIFKQKGLVVTLQQAPAIEMTGVNKPITVNTANSPISTNNNNHILEKSPTFLGFDFDGRMGRLNFINAYLVILLLFGLLLLANTYFLDETYRIVSLIITICLFLGYHFLAIRIYILRLHDSNNSAWLSLLYLVPLVNVFLMMVLIVMPGTVGSNKYGNAVARGSILGLIAFVIVLLLSPVLMFGYIKYQDAEHKKQLDGIYQQLIVYQDKIELALVQNKIPTLYQSTLDKKKYYPLGMAYDGNLAEEEGEIEKDYSTNPIVKHLRTIGLELPATKEVINDAEKGDELGEDEEEYNDDTISYYAYLDDTMGDLAGVAIVFERDDNKKWSCNLYNNDEGELKNEHLPGNCQ